MNRNYGCLNVLQRKTQFPRFCADGYGFAATVS